MIPSLYFNPKLRYNQYSLDSWVKGEPVMEDSFEIRLFDGEVYIKLCPV